MSVQIITEKTGYTYCLSSECAKCLCTCPLVYPFCVAMKSAYHSSGMYPDCVSYLLIDNQVVVFLRGIDVFPGA